MTDLEITRLCAEAMGLREDRAVTGEGPRMWIHGKSDGPYDPLHEDAQTMALVKKFDMVIEREKDKSFGVTLFGNERKGGPPTFVVRNQPNLNRAICECVAKMQQAKQVSAAPLSSFGRADHDRDIAGRPMKAGT